MNIDSIQFLTPDELAQFLKISKPTIYRLVDNRKIPFYRINGSLRFDKKDILDYLQKNRIETIKHEYDSKNN